MSAEAFILMTPEILSVGDSPSDTTLDIWFYVTLIAYAFLIIIVCMHVAMCWEWFRKIEEEARMVEEMKEKNGVCSIPVYHE